MLDIKYKVIGAENSRQTIQFVDRKIREFKTPLERIRNRMKELIELNFESEGQLFGQPWRKLAPSTIQHKKWLALRRGIGLKENANRILKRTGEMEKSFVYDIKKTSNGYQLKIWNRKPYFAKHQSTNPSVRTITLAGFRKDFGPIRGRPKQVVLPRRVMLAIDRKTDEEIKEIGFSWLNRIKRKVKRADAEGWVKI
jgi:phage gpG-like protein